MVVERDTVLVPAGWDSWGKIRVLREGFDCEGASTEWDDDLDEDGEKEGGARKVYEEVIPDPEAEDQVNVICRGIAQSNQAGNSLSSFTIAT